MLAQGILCDVSKSESTQGGTPVPPCVDWTVLERHCEGTGTCGRSSCRCDDDLSSYRPGGHGCGHLEIRIDGEGGHGDATEGDSRRLGQPGTGNGDDGSDLAACRSEASYSRRYIKRAGTGGRAS